MNMSTQGNGSMGKDTRRPAHGELSIPSDMPVDAVRREFARRLQKAMIEKGWTQSELARAAAPHAPDKRRIRDNISKYIRGKVLPGPLHLAALAKALGMKPGDLLPSRPTAGGADASPFDIRETSDGNVWLRVNQAVPWDIALEIGRLLKGGK